MASLADMAKALGLSGLVSENDEAARRFDLCASCPELRTKGIRKGTCQQCGCLMKAKVKVASATCPLGRW